VLVLKTHTAHKKKEKTFSSLQQIKTALEEGRDLIVEEASFAAAYKKDQ